MPHSSNALAVAVLVAVACAGPLADAALADEPPTNLLYIGEGGIALADQSEKDQNWRTFAINLVDGTNRYGWTSAPAVRLPHTLQFELERPSVIRRIVLDSTFEAVVGYDGKRSQPPAGGPLRRFRLLSSDPGERPEAGRAAGRRAPPIITKGV